MGYNIAGAVLDRNYDRDLTALTAKLGYPPPAQVAEISVEKAMGNWTPEGEWRVVFGKAGVLVFTDHQTAAMELGLPGDGDAMTYAYSATAMTFCLRLVRNGKVVRSFWENDHQKELEEGAPVPEETEHPTGDGLIFHLMNDILGEEWMKIDEHQSVAYQLTW